MATVKLTYDARNSVAQTIMQLIHKVGVFKVEQEDDKSPYNEEFVEKIKRGEKSKGKFMKIDDIWK